MWNGKISIDVKPKGMFFKLQKRISQASPYLERAYEKGQVIEEPCEVKVSRMVLKTSGSRERIA